MFTYQLDSYAAFNHALFWCLMFQGLKCRSQDEKNNDEFAEIAKMCLSNMSSWDNPSMNNKRNYSSGRYDIRRHNNRNSYDGNTDNSHDGMYNRNNRDYNTRNYNGDNDNGCGMWRKQQHSGGKFWK